MIDAITSKVLTMSSRDIAELTGYRHDNVRRTIKMLADRNVIALPQIEEVPNDGPGPGTITCYMVGKRDSYIIVAQLSPEFTARLVDRWQELEDQQAPQVPATFAAALRLAADQAEKLALQAAELDKARPAVEFVDRYVDAQGGVTFRELAKLLGEKEWLVKIWLIEKGVLHLSGTSMIPYAKHVQAGRVFVKAGIAENGRAYSQTLFTAKGVAWVCGLYRSEK